MTNASGSQAVQTLNKLIESIPVAMLTTQDEDGSLRSRPMMSQKAPFDGTLWFFTKADSGKVAEVRQDQQVNVAYVDQQDSRYVSISGKARLVRDQEKMVSLWDEQYRPWFPQGIDDEQMALLRVEVTSAESWDEPTGQMVKLEGF